MALRPQPSSTCVQVIVTPDPLRPPRLTTGRALVAATAVICGRHARVPRAAGVPTPWPQTGSPRARHAVRQFRLMPSITELELPEVDPFTLPPGQPPWKRYAGLPHDHWAGRCGDAIV